MSSPSPRGPEPAVHDRAVSTRPDHASTSYNHCRPTATQGRPKAPPSGRSWARFHEFEGQIIDIDKPVFSQGWILTEEGGHHG